MGNRNLLPEKHGAPRVSTYPACRRFKFGDGRRGAERFAAESTAGIACFKETFAAFALDADTPALLSKGSLEALGGPPDFACGVLPVRKQGVGISLRVYQMGRNILSVVSCDDGRPGSGKCPKFPASCLEWAFEKKSPNLSNGGSHLPCVADGVCYLEPPQTFSACTAFSPAEARGRCPPDPKKIAMKLYANRGHASAQQLRRVPLDSFEGKLHSPNFADEVLK